MSFIATQPGQVVSLLAEHLLIVLAGLALAAAIAIPLGIAVDRIRGLELPVMLGTGLLYVVPSLALFAFLIPWTGLGKVTAIAAQAVYSLLVIARNTAVGLRAVPAPAREAAIACGLSGPQTLLWVELPAALPVILGGVRIAAVMGVGIASIAAYIGAGGLGTLIFRGIATVDGDLVLAGAAPIAALALLLDGGLRRLEARMRRRRG